MCVFVCVRKCMHVKGSVYKGMYVFKHVEVGKRMCVCMFISSCTRRERCVFKGVYVCVHACLCPLLLLLGPQAKPS